MDSQQQAHANDQPLSIQLPQPGQAEARQPAGDDGVAIGGADIKEDGEVLVQETNAWMNTERMINKY